MNKKGFIWKFIKWLLIITLVSIIFAYGFQITDVDLTEFRKESRIESRVRVARNLASPNIVFFEQEKTIALAPIQIPCIKDLPESIKHDDGNQYIVLSESCAEPGALIIIEGFYFPPNAKGPVSFIPSSDPDHTITLRTVTVRTDQDGYFTAEFELPDRPNFKDYQIIRATLKTNVGMPKLTNNALLTWDKIVETVFMAMIATVFGTLLAIPVSFFAARNLMQDIQKPLISISFGIIGLMVGVVPGLFISNYIKSLLSSIPIGIPVLIVLMIVIPFVLWNLLRFTLSNNGEENSRQNKIIDLLIQVVIILFAIVWLYQIANLGLYIGNVIFGKGGLAAIIGNFIYQLADILVMIIPLIIALLLGAILSGKFGKIGDFISDNLENMALLKTLNIFFSAIIFGGILAFLGYIVDWFYQINNSVFTLWIPGSVGVIMGIIVAVVIKPRNFIPVGMVIYFITRSSLNIIRSIEPLVMVIVAVIWVGIGPFAGVLALSLHTIAALAKLYSEQVESIQPGPVEALQATGANRLQTIVFAVIPQIIPPYISFTMYRWDINVRMSTIIGFAGGGGIGALLFQNLQLGDYQSVSAQMIAIAIVVASMDYISSILRERFV